MAQMLLQLVEYAAPIVQYLMDMGVLVNVRKCALATTTRVSLIMVWLDTGNKAVVGAR